uniref:Pupal cuticle protein 36 n=1 Tax=Elaeis guineensis var. tenera TaxID=51953 RepID=A0A6J0PA42_ELAGV|nr:pupal cuticle protein 36 [Elaeis guineensis]
MGRFELDLFKPKLIYHHLLSRSLVIKILLVSTAVAVLPILASLRKIDPTYDDCDGAPVTLGISLPAPILDAVVVDLMARKWLWRGDRALCVGRGSSPAAAAAMKRMGGAPGGGGDGEVRQAAVPAGGVRLRVLRCSGPGRGAGEDCAGDGEGAAAGEGRGFGGRPGAARRSGEGGGAGGGAAEGVGGRGCAGGERNFAGGGGGGV